jgi:phospholipase/carboxylesterase
MTTLRGEHPVELTMTWRLDGAAARPDAPLVLALHGMGMDEDKFAALVAPLFALPIRVLVPRGPFPVEVRGEGRIGASWYAYDGDQERFRRELVRTERVLLDLLRTVEAAHGLAPRPRFLLGFSQGGYCGAFLAIRHPEIFRGMVISGARVKTEFLEEDMRAAAAAGFRALLCHGRRDRAVPLEAAERGLAALRSAGIESALETFDAAHSLGSAQVASIARWIEGVAGLSPTAAAPHPPPAASGEPPFRR